jgi:hypothetical protein
MSLGFYFIGWPPVLIVGGSGIVAFVLWKKTYRHHPLDPALILPPFLLTVAALEVHMMEEYVTKFGPAMSRLFAITWSERSFLFIFAFIGPCLYALTALGIYKRTYLAGFMAWFIFIGPGVAEFSHFIFPLLRPAIEPLRVGNFEGMPNYYFRATGEYYFSGLYTAILPMVPGIYGIKKILERKQET